MPRLPASDSYVASSADVFEEFTLSITEGRSSGSTSSRMSCAISSTCSGSVILTTLDTTLQNPNNNMILNALKFNLLSKCIYHSSQKVKM